MSRIFGLDVLRACAILFVIIGHCLFLFPSNSFLELLSSVFIFGVEIFFVLSGFLIGCIFVRSMESGVSVASIREFWRRRWYRTLPNYVLFLALNVIAFSILKDGYSFNGLYILFLQNFAWMPDSFFSVSWSLAVEEWFYILLPLLFCLAFSITKSVGRGIFLVVLSVILAVLIARLYAAYSLNLRWNEELRLVVVYRLDALMYGVLAALLCHFRNDLFVGFRVSVAALGFLCFILAVAIRHLGWMAEYHWASALMFPIASVGIAMMIPCFYSWRVTRANFWINLVSFVSLTSYSAYLIHIILLEFVRLFLSKLIDIYSFPVSLLVAAVWLLVVFFLSGINYKYFEVPMMMLRDRK